VGARLPHAWIRVKQTSLAPVDVSYVDEFSAEDVRQRRYSTLDLCQFDQFTLLGNLDVPGVKTCRLDEDYELIEGTHAQKWIAGAGLIQGGGLLVRPDQHILMVLQNDTTAEEVELCVRQHLSR
jgi:hypothetical protein